MLDCTDCLRLALAGCTLWSPAAGLLALQVSASQSGSLVFKIDPLAPAHEALAQNDVVTDIDGVPIADGRVPTCCMYNLMVSCAFMV